MRASSWPERPPAATKVFGTHERPDALFVAGDPFYRRTCLLCSRTSSSWSSTPGPPGCLALSFRQPCSQPPTRSSNRGTALLRLLIAAFCTNATLGNVRFYAGYEGEADISRSLAISRKRRVPANNPLQPFHHPTIAYRVKRPRCETTRLTSCKRSGGGRLWLRCVCTGGIRTAGPRSTKVRGESLDSRLTLPRPLYYWSGLLFCRMNLPISRATFLTVFFRSASFV